MTGASNADPDPRRIPGVETGGGVPAGETPPAESGTGTATGPHRPLRRGWAAGPLLVVWLLVIACALFFLGYAIVLATR